MVNFLVVLDLKKRFFQFIYWVDVGCSQVWRRLWQFGSEILDQWVTDYAAECEGDCDNFAEILDQWVTDYAKLATKRGIT